MHQINDLSDKHGLDSFNWEALKPKAAMLVLYENPSHHYPGKCAMVLEAIPLDKTQPQYRVNLAVSLYIKKPSYLEVYKIKTKYQDT